MAPTLYVFCLRVHLRPTVITFGVSLGWLVDLKKELDAKNAECAASKCQVQELHRVSVSAVEPHDKTQLTSVRYVKHFLSY